MFTEHLIIIRKAIKNKSFLPIEPFVTDMKSVLFILVSSFILFFRVCVAACLRATPVIHRRALQMTNGLHASLQACFSASVPWIFISSRNALARVKRFLLCG